MPKIKTSDRKMLFLFRMGPKRIEKSGMAPGSIIWVRTGYSDRENQTRPAWFPIQMIFDPGPDRGSGYGKIFPVMRWNKKTRRIKMEINNFTLFQNGWKQKKHLFLG